jgi:hypothetical protein
LIDWAASAAWAQAIATLLGAMAVIAAAKIGSARFGDWLRQQQTSRRIDAAERVLTLVYRLKRVFSSIRSPGVFGAEASRAEQRLQDVYAGFANMNPDQKRRLVTCQVVLSRLGSHESEWTELFECLPIAKAHFGAAVEEELERLWQQNVAVQVAAQEYGDGDLSPDQRREFEADLWEGFGGARLDRDRVKAELESAMARIEASLLPLLRSDIAP